MRFEWDTEKAKSNISKHGVDFNEAMSIFGDPLEVTIADPAHSYHEQRFLSIGLSSLGRLLVVSYTERNDSIRIISARTATTAERKHYESTH
ncbi:MAG: BrnT family toxin [Candidatus Methylumidiphilus sp.]